MKTNERTKSSIKIDCRYSNKVFVVNMVVIILLAIVSGLFMGFKMIADSESALPGVSETYLRDDIVKVRASVGNKTPMQAGAINSYIIAYDNAQKSKDMKIVGSGYVNAMGVKQAINSLNVTTSSDSFFENVSVSSFVQAATRYYQSGERIEYVNGDIGSSSVSWTGKKSSMSVTEYKETTGTTFNDYIPYIVSSKTVKGVGAITQDGDNYTFLLILDKDYSTINYKKKMKYTGGLAGYPKFTEDVKLTVTLDKDYNLLEVISEESYKAKKGIITASSKGYLKSNFYFNGAFAIPQTNEKTNF